MANRAIGGFRWVKSATGTGSMPVEIHPVISAYGSAIYKGDPVRRVADGTMELCTATSTDIYGICDGAEQYWNGTEMKRGNYLPSSTYTLQERQSKIRVIPVRGQIFEVDAAAATATTEAGWQALIGENCDMSTYAAGSTVTGRSAVTLDTSTHATTTAQWRIHSLGQVIDNDPTVANFKLNVMCNESGDVVFTTTGDA